MGYGKLHKSWVALNKVKADSAAGRLVEMAGKTFCTAITVFVIASAWALVMASSPDITEIQAGAAIGLTAGVWKAIVLGVSLWRN